MAANKVTYSDKVGVNPKETHINQVWDDDMNELKLVVNDNADLFDGLETEVNANTLDIVDLQNRTATITTEHPVLIPFDFPLNTKTSLDSLHGSLLINNSEDGIILNSGQDIIGDGGISKLMAVVLAGTDLVGSFTITGTSVNRNTGVETPADSEIVNVNGLSIDTSTIDSNGNQVHNYSNAYLSTKWWKGTLTFSTTDLDLTEIRFAQLSFEQFNDSPGMTVNSFDANYIISNTNAVMDAYLYTVVVSGSVVTVTNIASLHHDSGEFADASFRKRIGNLDTDLDGLTSGVFVDLYLKPDALQYFSSFTMKIWATKTTTVNVDFT
jgi:hypothetical protein